MSFVQVVNHINLIKIFSSKFKIAFITDNIITLNFIKVHSMVNCVIYIIFNYNISCMLNRPKWLNVLPNVKIGTIVILKEDNVPIMSWPMARVTNTFPGHDGHVRAVEVINSKGNTHVRSVTKNCILPVDVVVC